MKKSLLLVALIIVTFLAIIFSLRKKYTPSVVATILLSENPSAILPKKVSDKIEKIKIPVNNYSEKAIEIIHNKNISIEQILKAIDNVNEEDAYELLTEINALGEIESHDVVFDMAKNKFPVDFDVEQLRIPFKENADLKLINKALNSANKYRDNNLIDFESAKSIVKKIIIEKEKEFNEKLKNQSP